MCDLRACRFSSASSGPPCRNIEFLDGCMQHNFVLAVRVDNIPNVFFSRMSFWARCILATTLLMRGYDLVLCILMHSALQFHLLLFAARAGLASLAH